MAVDIDDRRALRGPCPRATARGALAIPRLPSSTAPIRLPLEEASLFLDLDGTLVEFESDPGAVFADAETRRVLSKALARLDGRLAVLSGRSIASVDEVLGGGVLTVAGVHGLQRRTALGAIVETPPHPAIEEVADALVDFAASDRRLRVEHKGQSVALHFRDAPAAAPAAIALAAHLARAAELEMQRGDMVVEVRTPGPDKGFALRQFMRNSPFAQTRPIFIGDDLTDEAAFAAAQALGGAGILVGPWRETAARRRLTDPRAVRAWIDRSLDAGHFDLAAPEWRRHGSDG